MCLCFLAMSALQAYVLNNSAQGSARHAWYEERKAAVVALPQQAVGRLAAHKDGQSASELRALVISMVRCAEGRRPGGQASCMHLGGAHSLKGAGTHCRGCASTHLCWRTSYPVATTCVAAGGGWSQRATTADACTAGLIPPHHAVQPAVPSRSCTLRDLCCNQPVVPALCGACTIVCGCSELATTSFPGCSLMLMLLEDASLDSGIVTCHVVQAAPDVPDLHRQQQQMPLELLPTVELACRRGQMLARSALGAGLHG